MYNVQVFRYDHEVVDIDKDINFDNEICLDKDIQLDKDIAVDRPCIIEEKLPDFSTPVFAKIDEKDFAQASVKKESDKLLKANKDNVAPR